MEVCCTGISQNTNTSTKKERCGSSGKINYHITITPRRGNPKTGIEVSVTPIKLKSRFCIWKTNNGKNIGRSVSERVTNKDFGCSDQITLFRKVQPSNDPVSVFMSTNSKTSTCDEYDDLLSF